MRSFPSLAAGLAALLAAGGALASGPTRTHLFAERTPRAAGETFDASARGLVVARAPWAAAIELGASRVVELASGERAVRMPQMHRGLPVAMRGATVTFAADGAARLVAVTLEDDLPGDITPAVTAAQAVALAAARTGVAADPSRARLAIWPGADGAVLAWVIYPGVVAGLPYAPVAVIDAASGRLVIRYNAVVDVNQSEIYPTNPTKSPALVQVTLPVPAGETVLANDLVETLNCIDQKSVKAVFGFDVHTCDVLHTAAPDANGDYLIPPGADTAPEDAFAEVSMFHHANRVYDFFRTFEPGFEVQAGPLATVANLRMPDGFATFDVAKMGNPDLPLVPFQNAFFSPSNPIFSDVFGIEGAAMWFGQGPSRDYSYDGDVVYHEFGHAAVEATIKLVGTPHLDDLGVVYSPGGMNEGLADYFSSALAGDPDVGEYASKDFAPGSTSIRSLTKGDKCPTAIGGEVHQDATLFSGALWDVRATLAGAEAAALDAAVFAAMNTASTGDLAYEELAALIVEAVAASSLGPAPADALTAAFTARGVLPRCTRVLEYAGAPVEGPPELSGLWIAPGMSTTGISNLGWTPGVVQVRAALPEGTGPVTIELRRVPIQAGTGFGTPGTPFAPKLLVKFGDEPILFEYGPFAPVGDVRVLDLAEDGTSYTVTTDAPAGATGVHVMVASSGEEDGAYTDVTITSAQAPVGPTTGASTSGGATGGTSASTGGDQPKAGPEEEAGGCGCAVPGSDGAPARGAALAGLLLALGLASRRRR